MQEVEQTNNYSVIKDSLEYYDKNNAKFTKLLKKINYVRFNKTTENSSEYNTISMFDSDRKLICESRYEYIGLYNNDSKTWIWAWSIPRYNKVSTTIARKLIKYGIELDNNMNLKTELVNSRYKISNVIQIDILLACASYLSKKRIIFPYVSSNLSPLNHKFDMFDISQQPILHNTNFNKDPNVYIDPVTNTETNFMLVTYIALLDIDDLVFNNTD